MTATRSLSLAPQNRVWLHDIGVRVVAAVGVDQVMVELPDGTAKCVAVRELSSAPKALEQSQVKSPDLATISPEDWSKVEARIETVRRMVEMPRRTKAQVVEAATSIGISYPLLYKLMARMRNGGGVATALLPLKSGPKNGSTRLSSQMEAIIDAAIKGVWLSKQQASMEKVIEDVKDRCRLVGMRPPSPTTVRARIGSYSSEVALRARRGANAANNKYRPVAGNFPETAWPLQVVQIDHTLVDAILVDRENRQPIGRPWLTLAIDVHTRMVAGFLLSLEPPQATSVALCLAHAVLPKEEWLARWKVEVSWPVWGKPDTIHVDNGKDFRSEALSRGCQQHGITLDYRPVRTPHYGGHIERLIGTLMGEVHLLPGTTQSNIRAKGEYDSEKHSCLTLEEMQEWITRGISVYHNKLHSGIGMSPLASWKKSILGTTEQPGRGLPARIVDPERFLIDFLPLERRAVTRTGVHLFHIDYYSDVLRPMIGRGERHIVRYDPRDLSRVWLLSKSGDYFALPYRERHRPPISLWEQKMIARRLQAEGKKDIDAEAIFNEREKMRNLVAGAVAATKKERRQAERRRQAPVAKPKLHGNPEREDHPRPTKRFIVEEW